MVGYFKVANNGRSWDYAYLLGRKIEEKESILLPTIQG